MSSMKTKLLGLVLISIHLYAAAGDLAPDDYVAHEWGTFTSVQGADGVQIEWNPFIASDLPKFVYDRNKQSPNAARNPFLVSKDRMVTLVRMETPVIYFYSELDRKVDVRVDFPQGTITEWFPRATRFGPFTGTNRAELAPSRKSFLHWSEVEVLPRGAHADLEKRIPHDNSNNHYFAARATDADFVRVSRAKANDANPPEHEGFLFYRGVGNFRAPLEVSMGSSEDYVRLRNIGTEPLSHLFVLMVQNGEARFIPSRDLAPQENTAIRIEADVALRPLSTVSEELRQRLTDALVREGLFEREAAAMVQTWRESWFEEEGLRVLYILPRPWTDRILPLSLTPAPRELVRVMVGRAEMITPGMEWALLKQIVRYAESDPIGRQQVIADVRELGLGRFGDAALRRVLGKTPNREFSRLAWELMNATLKPADPKLARR